MALSFDRLCRFASVFFQKSLSAEEICGDKEQVCKYPGGGGGKAGGIEADDADEICRHASANHFKDACKCGCGGEAHSLNGKSDYIYKGEGKIECCEGGEELPHEGNKVKAPFVQEYHCHIVSCEEYHKETAHGIDKSQK